MRCQMFQSGAEIALLCSPLLSQLVREAVDANWDVEAALARVRAARALLDVAAAGDAPKVGADALAGRQRLSENGPIDVGRLSDLGFRGALGPVARLAAELSGGLE